MELDPFGPDLGRPRPQVLDHLALEEGPHHQAISPLHPHPEAPSPLQDPDLLRSVSTNPQMSSRSRFFALVAMVMEGPNLYSRCCCLYHPWDHED